MHPLSTTYQLALPAWHVVSLPSLEVAILSSLAPSNTEGYAMRRAGSAKVACVRRRSSRRPIHLQVQKTR